MTWDLGNSLNWEPAGGVRGRGSVYSAQPIPGLNYDKYWKRIPRQFFEVNSRTLSIGVMAEYAKPDWIMGVWVSQRLLIRPDSTTSFPWSIHTKQFATRLNFLTLIEFPEYDSYPYLLAIDVPKWHKEIYLEVWEYDP